MIKDLVRSALKVTGYEVKRLNPDKPIAPPRYPVEFEQDDVRIADGVINAKMTMVNRERLAATMMACKYVSDWNLPGAFVECGVWRGGVSIAAKQTFERLGSDRQVYLYDTFAGMTAPQEVDRNWKGAAATDKFRQLDRDNHNQWAYSAKDEVLQNFTASGVDLSQVTMIEGDILETLNDEGNLPDQIAVLRLDTDWYESTKKELEVLYPRLCRGGVLLIDDYGQWDGARKAYEEYFSGPASRPFTVATDREGRACIKI